MIIISCCSLLGCWKQMQEQKQNNAILLLMLVFLQYLSLPPVQENTWDFTLWFTVIYIQICMYENIKFAKNNQESCLCKWNRNTLLWISEKLTTQEAHSLCVQLSFLEHHTKDICDPKVPDTPHPLSPSGNCHVYRHFPFIPLLNPDPVPWTRMKMVPEWWIITF